MSELGQSRYFDDVRVTSAPPITDIHRRLVQVGFWLRVYGSTPSKVNS